MVGYLMEIKRVTLKTRKKERTGFDESIIGFVLSFFQN